MSGISGAWRFSGDAWEAYPKKRLENLKNTLTHRGNMPPAVWRDNDVVFISHYFQAASQDTANGLYTDIQNGIVCAVAGRIYNTELLAQTLEAKGERFTNRKQEEIVASAYHVWGISFPAYLEGQFGGVIWDRNQKRLWMFRDRTGQRDLYYTIMPQGCYFGSELKAILPYLGSRPRLHASTMANALMHQMMYEPLTAYEGIYKLEKATLRWVDETGKTGAHLYWDIFKAYEEALEAPETDYNVAKRKVRQTIFDAVASMRLPGEEVGAFLSGGFDSTILAGALAKITGRRIHTFSLGFQDAGYDESEMFTAAAVHLNTEHHTFSLAYHDLEADWDRLWLNFDEPFCDVSFLAEFACARMASSYVRCALGGEGGDELFCGYRLNLEVLNTELGYRVPLSSKKFQSRSLLTQRFLPEVYQFQTNAQVRNLLKSPEMHNYLQSQYARWLYQMPGSVAQRMGMCFFTGNHMAELTKVDRACQLAGLETRRPLHTKAVVDLAMHLPLKFCIQNGEQRYIYKKAFCDMLPDKIYYRKKMGFSIPVVEWLHAYRQDEVRRLFNRDLIEAQGVFRYEALSPHLEAFFAGTTNMNFRYIYGAQKWYNDYYLNISPCSE